MDSVKLSIARKASKKILRDIHAGNVKVLQEFHEKYPDIHWSFLRYEKTGDTILHVASRLGHLTLIDYLLKNYCPITINCRNNDNKTALHEAAQFAQFEAAKLLLKNGADVNVLKKADWTPLMLACTKIDERELDDNNYKTVEVLLQNGAVVNYQNKDGWTALHLISREGDVRILDLLLEHGLDTMRITKNGRTALHISTLHERVDMTKKLIEVGLDINKKDSCGSTPLHESVLSENVTITDLLLESKADLNCRNKSDFTILHLAAFQGNLTVLDYIVSKLGIDINVTTSSGLVPLHCAARNNQMEAYNFLLMQGADENIKDHFGRFPSDYMYI